MAGLLEQLQDEVTPQGAEVAGSSLLGQLPSPSPLETVYRGTLDVEPERVAKVVAVSAALGMDKKVVDANLDTADKVAKAPPPTFWRDLEQSHPGTAKFLLDPERMAMVKDDIEGLSTFESITHDASDALARGSREVRLATLSRAQRDSNDPNLHEADIRKIEGELESYYSRAPRGRAFVYNAFSQAPNMGYSYYKALQYGVPTGLTFAGAAGAAGLVTGPGASLTASGGFSLGMKVGGAYGMFEAARTLEGELAFREYLKTKDASGKPLDRAAAGHMADIVGAVNGALEATADIIVTKIVGKPLADAGSRVAAKLAGKVPGSTRLLGFIGANPKVFEGMTLGRAVRQAGKMILEAEGAELPTEYAQEVVTGLGKAAAIKESGQDIPVPTLSDILKDARGVLSPTAQSTAFFGGAGGGLHIANSIGSIRQAEVTKNTYLAMGDATKGSKLRERLPAAHREFVEGVTKDTPVEHVFLDPGAAEVYFQSKNIDIQEAMAEVGAADAYAEAKQTGAKVKIPLALWTDKVAGSEHYAGLAEDISFSAEDLSYREAQQQITSARAEVDSMQAKAQETIKTDAAAKAGYDLVYGDIWNKLQAIARPETISEKEWPKVVEAQARVVASQAVAESRRRGITVEEYYTGQRRPDIVGEGATRQEGALSQEAGKGEGGSGRKSGPSPRASSRWLRPAEGPSTPQTGASEEASPRTSSLHPETQFPDQGLVRSPYADRLTVKADGVQLKVGEEAWSADWIDVHPDLRAALLREGEKLYPPEAHFGARLEARAPFLIRISKAAMDRIDSVLQVIKAAPAESMDRQGAASLQEYLLQAVEEYHLASGDSHIPTDVLTAIDALGARAESETLFQRVKKAIGGDAGGQVLQQKGDKPAPRGFYDPTRNMIALMKKGDPSTLLHEFSHVWLKDTFDFVRSGKASELYLKDWATMAEFLGVKEGQDKLTEIQQERFAAAFEVYLYEGNAPSEALRDIFGRIRQWMTKIYRNASKALGVELNAEVRGVFDRMLATEDEIAEVQSEAGYEPMQVEGLDPAIAARLDSLRARARQSAEDAILREQMSTLTTAARKASEDRRRDLTDSTTKALKETPLYRAAEDLREHVAATREEKQAFGHDMTAITIAKKFLSGKAGPQTTTYMEAMAEIYGFADGKDLAEKLVAAKPLDEAVAVQVNEEMARAGGIDRSAMKEQAIRALYADEGKMLELLADEREALASLLDKAEKNLEVSRRRAAERALELEAAKEYARQTLGKKPIKEATNYRPYMTAERNAAVRFKVAMRKKAYQEALKARREQMFSRALVAESLRLREREGVDRRYLDSFINRGGDQKEMPYGFISQIDGLLSRYGLAAPRTQSRATFLAIAKEMQGKDEQSADIANATGFRVDARGNLVPETLRDLVDRINEDYITVTLPESVLAGQEKLAESLTPDDLRDLKEAVKALNDTGRKFTRFLSAFLKGDIKDAASELRASIEREVGQPYADRLAIGSAHASALRERLDAVLSLPDAFIGDMVNLITLVRYLDGGKDDGPAHKYIYRPLKAAEGRKLARYEQMTKEVNGIFERHFHPDAIATIKETRHYFGFVGRHLTGEEVMMVALNWGNDGNRDRIKRGFQIDEGQVETILSTLDHEQWKFCQEVWDYLDTYWPEIVKMETMVSGSEPKKVDSTPIRTRYGAFRGGYFPIVYDFEKSEDALRTTEQKNALYKQYSSAQAHTDKGHTQARVDSMRRPIRLSMDVIFNHLENVVHDLEYRAVVIDLSRLLKMHDAKGSISRAVGIPGMKAINETLKAVASDQGEFLSAADKALRWFRFRGTFAVLAYRAFTMPMDLTGNVINMAWEIGPVRMKAAMQDFVRDPRATTAFVNSKSDMMRHRALVRDRDIMEIKQKWAGEDSSVRQFGFIFQRLADEAVAFPLWAEAYKHNLAEHGDEKAARIADEAVVRTVGSGSIIDQVGAQRGPETKKVLSMYYSWSSMMFNRAWLDGKMAGLEYNKGNTGAAAMTVAKAAFYAWGLHAINETFWRELLRNRKSEDDKERKKRIWSRILTQPFGYFWLVRDIANPVVDTALGKRSEYRFSPMEQAIDSIVKTAGRGARIAFTDDKVDARFMEDAARAGSLMAGIPVSVNNLVFNFYDWLEGHGELTWRDLLTRRTKK